MNSNDNRRTFILRGCAASAALASGRVLAQSGGSKIDERSSVFRCEEVRNQRNSATEL